VALLVFGPKRLPEIGRSLGRGMREFKDSVSGSSLDGEDASLPAATVTPSPASRGASEGGRFCHACGEELAQSARFCSACGAAAEPSSLLSGAGREM